MEYVRIQKDGKMICPICENYLGRSQFGVPNYCRNCGTRLYDKTFEDLKENKEIVGKDCFVIYNKRVIKAVIVDESPKYYMVKIGSGNRNYLKDKVFFRQCQ